MALRVLSGANRDCGAAGTIMSLSPSLRTTVPSPGSPYSLGMRTAWLRPFLNILTLLSLVTTHAPSVLNALAQSKGARQSRALATRQGSEACRSAKRSNLFSHGIPVTPASQSLSL
jgi:hypothetical protein